MQTTNFFWYLFQFDGDQLNTRSNLYGYQVSSKFSHVDIDVKKCNV